MSLTPLSQFIERPLENPPCDWLVGIANPSIDRYSFVKALVVINAYFNSKIILHYIPYYTLDRKLWICQSLLLVVFERRLSTWLVFFKIETWGWILKTILLSHTFSVPKALNSVKLTNLFFGVKAWTCLLSRGICNLLPLGKPVYLRDICLL